jgi:hypothetical protein
VGLDDFSWFGLEEGGASLALESIEVSWAGKSGVSSCFKEAAMVDGAGR